MVGENFTNGKRGSGYIRIDEKQVIRITDKRHISKDNPKGVIPTRFNLCENVGVYKTKQELGRWFKVIAYEDFEFFEAVEIDLQHVYLLLGEYGKLEWLLKHKFKEVFDFIEKQTKV